jgi:kynurenine formamidase
MAKPSRIAFGSAAILLATALAFAQSSSQKPALDEIASGKTRVIDLSYAINEKMVPWPGDAKAFEAKIKATVEKDGYFTRSFWMLEHYGTHMDAPAHFPPGTTTVDQIAAEKFFGPAVVLDVRKEAERDPDYQVSAKDIAAWEVKHGKIPAGSILVLRTGWSARWPDVARYRNQDANGKMHFPGYSVEAAKLLLDRKVNGLGCDTLSIDPGNSPDFPVHHLVLGAGVYQLENLADLGGLPEAGGFLIAAPIKLEGGSGGAVRVFALVWE